MEPWVFFDASALVKRYSYEPGTPFINGLIQQTARDRKVCSVLGVAEVVSILVRKRNDGRLGADLFAQSMKAFRAEVLEDPNWTLLPVDGDLILACMPMIASYNLNATDAILLRSAVDFHESLKGPKLLFVTSDQRLARAATHESLIVADPEKVAFSELRGLLA